MPNDLAGIIQHRGQKATLNMLLWDPLLDVVNPKKRNLTGQMPEIIPSYLHAHKTHKLQR